MIRSPLASLLIGYPHQDGLEVYLPMAGLVDKDKEMARLEKQASKLAKDIDILEKRLSGSNFVEKVCCPVLCVVLLWVQFVPGTRCLLI